MNRHQIARRVPWKSGGNMAAGKFSKAKKQNEQGYAPTGLTAQLPGKDAGNAPEHRQQSRNAKRGKRQQKPELGLANQQGMGNPVR